MIRGGTVKNSRGLDKPNEDSVYIDNERNIVIVLDGVSRDRENGIYPNPSPAAIVTEIIRNSCVEYLEENMEHSSNTLSLLEKSMIYANDKVKLFNNENNLDFAPGAVGIVGLISKQVFYYAFIGDCYGRVISNGEVSVFTECQTEEIAKHKGQYTAREIRNYICNNPDHPCGYGVLNGVDTARCFIRTGQISEYDRIILSSDGPEHYLNGCDVAKLLNNTYESLLTESQNGVNLDDITIAVIDR